MPPIRIAVIGSGIAGLAAAHRVSQEPGVEITLLEKFDRIGMDAHRLDLTVNDQICAVDVPSRMFNALQWPRLMRLYDELGIAYEPVTPTQTFSRYSNRPDHSPETFLKLDVAFRPERALLQLVHGQPRRLLKEAARLMKEGRHDLDVGIDPALTLRQYLQERDYTVLFRDAFLYPTLSSTVCTCSFAGLDGYPARIILDALRRLTDDRELMRTSNGTREVVSRITSHLAEVKTNHIVTAIVADQRGVRVSSRNGAVDTFDHVIMATQANTALKLLPAIAPNEIELLRSIPYEDVPIVVHRDDRLMPPAKSDWSTFNMGVIEDQGQASAMCTVWLNQFHDWSPFPDHFQTIMPVLPPDPSLVLAEIALQRPIVNAESVRAWAALEQLHRQPQRRIWFCGSWSSEGIPLLESGVVSAERVVNSILATRRSTS